MPLRKILMGICVLTSVLVNANIFAQTQSAQQDLPPIVDVYKEISAEWTVLKGICTDPIDGIANTSLPETINKMKALKAQTELLYGKGLPRWSETAMGGNNAWAWFETLVNRVEESLDKLVTAALQKEEEKITRAFATVVQEQSLLARFLDVQLTDPKNLLPASPPKTELGVLMIEVKEQLVNLHGYLYSITPPAPVEKPETHAAVPTPPQIDIKDSVPPPPTPGGIKRETPTKAAATPAEVKHEIPDRQQKQISRSVASLLQLLRDINRVGLRENPLKWDQPTLERFKSYIKRSVGKITAFTSAVKNGDLGQSKNFYFEMEDMERSAYQQFYQVNAVR